MKWGSWGTATGYDATGYDAQRERRQNRAKAMRI